MILSKKSVFYGILFCLAVHFCAFAQISNPVVSTTQPNPTTTNKVKVSGKDELVILTTTFGEIVFLLSDQTPLHKANFIKLAKSGFYDGTSFHRIIKTFMIQGGDPNSKDTDPNNDGIGGPGYTIPAEIVPGLSHIQGAVAAARMGDQENPAKASSGSQFYIVENRDGTHFLDNNYTVFGQVIKGLDVVEKIAEQPKNMADRPDPTITMQIKIKKMKRKKIQKKYGYSYPVL